MRADILMRVRSAARITAPDMLRHRPVSDAPNSPRELKSRDERGFKSPRKDCIGPDGASSRGMAWRRASAQARCPS